MTDWVEVRQGRGVYTSRGNTDRSRKRKFDIKLRFSQQNDFPYYIVSSEEFKFLGDGIELTVVDGIIGSTIAKKHFLALAPSLLRNTPRKSKLSRIGTSQSSSKTSSWS